MESEILDYIPLDPQMVRLRVLWGLTRDIPQGFWQPVDVIVFFSQNQCNRWQQTDIKTFPDFWLFSTLEVSRRAL